MKKILNNPIVSIFGDIHSNLIGLFNTISKLQKENSQVYDLILQLGDLGYFKNLQSMDKNK